ncbi:MAG: hypothetical protein EOM76_10655 [Sphingobacteriia bacterium]|nr:hypothetical protein [Sphingobacteriia bacterium]
MKGFYDCYFASAYIERSERHEGYYAENQARKGVVMNMKDWVAKLDAFLQFNEEAILNHQGKVSHEVAQSLAENEFEKFRIAQNKRIESDFDKVIQKLKD